MRKTLLMALGGLALTALVPVPSIDRGSAQALQEHFLGRETIAARRLRDIDEVEQGLRAERARLAECAATPCLTPSEAATLAFNKGPGERTRGRFILDVAAGTGPGNPNQLHTENLFYLASYRRFTGFGTLVVAIEPDSLHGLMQAAGWDAEKAPTVPRMMRLFAGKRVIVDGEVGLQRIEFRDWQTMQRNGDGYYQVWVRVNSPDQIRVIGPA